MGSSSPVPNPVQLGLLRHPGSVLSRRVAMARAAAVAPALRPWFVDPVPLVVVVLIAAHVLALGYWIYRLATDGAKQPGRSKKH